MEETFTSKLLKNLVDSFGKAFVPKKLRPYLKEYLFKAGVYEVPYRLFGSLFWVAVALTYFVYFLKIVDFVHWENPLKAFLIVFFSWLFLIPFFLILLASALYFYYNMRIFHRTKELEDRLPDYLTLVSTNLKGGLSFEKSLWAAIKPEFGVLANEIALVSKKVLTGSDVNEAMIEFSKKYDSPNLRRAMNLIVSEVDSGGRVVDVIDKIIENLKKTRQLKEEMAASTVTYIIFMGALVIIICPLLFALSYQLVNVMVGFGNKVATSIPASGQIPISISSSGMKPIHFRIFSVAAISVIAIFSAMIVSIIETGNVKGGLKYIPLFLFSGLFFLFIFSVLFDVIFKGLITF
ncbi:hypothetical protein D6783_03630 [Candidatus Woesearchaeota archaeon]|nr:MAG: hypothetical protein D6783_03630 [Candidatus Woesearchaeota archaeon]